MERVTGPAQRLLDASAASLAGEDLPRTVRVLELDTPALVLGSTQHAGLVDYARAERAGVEVARRRSGGAAVLVDPGLLWVEVVIPRHDPLWDDDAG
ncbi:MAG: lipoyl protein ligase domain-containing protein, partial [Acidimicrobiales bacterium]